MGITVPLGPGDEFPHPMSLPARFLGIFFSPTTTFHDIVRKPGFLHPLIALMISAVAVTETMLAKIGMERIIRLTLEQTGRASQMGAEQLQQAVERGAVVASILAHVGGVLGPPIYLLIMAAIGLGILHGIFGAAINFKTAFSVTCYANLPGVLGALMTLAIILGGDPDRFNPNNPAPTNVGFFLNPLETSKGLFTFASSIDLITVWFLGLLGIGLSQACSRRVKALSISLTFSGLWMIWVMGKVGLAMLG